jgi:hypothetical protein
MATDREQDLLKLIKDVYAHFTRDSLPIAKQIIAMEDQILGKTINTAVNLSFVPEKTQQAERPPFGGFEDDDAPERPSDILPNIDFDKQGKGKAAPRDNFDFPELEPLSVDAGFKDELDDLPF